ncbi:hypothetical protein MAR_019300 [Mya arenaria]|uniref:Uncharacterized protein n=1 Tax=Mya arenaria TaxID=6604 RepID=A0ABY7EK64_MYAAR|nr:uncharacterized protein LOC128239261 [Mya arenaria]WAR09342.1 hypothetical protein MAR_019300 [Mya arenaria]
MESTQSATSTVSEKATSLKIRYRGTQAGGQHDNQSISEQPTKCPTSAQGSKSSATAEVKPVTFEAFQDVPFSQHSTFINKPKKNKNQFGPGMSKRVQKGGIRQTIFSNDGKDRPKVNSASENSESRREDNVESGPNVSHSAQQSLTAVTLMSPKGEMDRDTVDVQLLREGAQFEEGRHLQATVKSKTCVNDNNSMMSHPRTNTKGQLMGDLTSNGSTAAPISLETGDHNATNSARSSEFCSLLSPSVELDGGTLEVQELREHVLLEETEPEQVREENINSEKHENKLMLQKQTITGVQSKEDLAPDDSATTSVSLEPDASASYKLNSEEEITQIHVRNIVADESLEMLMIFQSEAQAITDKQLTKISSATADLCIQDKQHLRSSTGDMGSCEGKKDFVILHADCDTERTHDYKEHLEDITRDANIRPPLSVDLYSSIDVNKPGLQGLEKLYDTYRNILVFVTRAFESDYYAKFQNEIVQTFSLQSGPECAYRVLQVWREYEKKHSTIIALKCLPGFPYVRFAGKPAMKRSYIDIVKTTVVKSRREIP